MSDSDQTATQPSVSAPPESPKGSFLQGQLFKGILIGVGVMFVLLTVFWAGMFIGHTKAVFNYRMSQHMGGKQQEMPFERMRERGPRMMMRAPFLGGHGAVGNVVSADAKSIVVSGPDDVKRTVLIQKTTRISKGKKSINASEIRKNDKVVVLGRPNRSGQIEAKAIRVLREGELPPGMPHEGGKSMTHDGSGMPGMTHDRHMKEMPGITHDGGPDEMPGMMQW